MKLHLGCGEDIKTGYINIDAQQPCDVQHDFRNPLPYADNSIDEIYTYDVIQLFSREEWLVIKKDWVRVLRQGGKFDVSCHDFEYVLRNFLQNTNDDRWGYWIRAIYAGQDGQYDYFKNAFTWEKLKDDLWKEGIGNFIEDRTDPSFIHLIGEKL